MVWGRIISGFLDKTTYVYGFIMWLSFCRVMCLIPYLLYIFLGVPPEVVPAPAEGGRQRRALRPGHDSADEHRGRQEPLLSTARRHLRS